MVELVRLGFTTENIENMDEMQIAFILDYSLDLKKKERILKKLEMAESVFYGNRASEPKEKNKAHKGFSVYRNWLKRNYRILFPKIKPQTVWHNLPKRKGKTKLM